MQDEIIEIYTKKEDIENFIKKLEEFSFDDLIKTNHFEFSVLQKNTNVSILKEKFRKFKRINLIQKRKHRIGNITYDLYYKLDDGTYLLYAIAFRETAKPLLINGFHVKRNFDKFKEKIIRAYKGG